MECGSPFSVTISTTFDKNALMERKHSMWRYSKVFPWINESNLASQGEGGTPSINIDKNVELKLEYISPTGSFKDRGTSMMFSSIISFLKKNKITRIIEDSSGNAGASISAYSAYLGLDCHIYAPNTVSGLKAKQIESSGATLVKVNGTREQVAKAAENSSRKSGFYASHIFNPFFNEGMRTVSYEICEQLNWNAPDYVFLPCSAGTLLLGVANGFRHLFDSGIISRIPTIVAGQTKQISPLYHAFQELPYSRPDRFDSIADALVSVEPPRLREMIESLRLCSGNVEITTEKEILESHTELARRGIYVEPSSAVSYSCFNKWRTSGRIQPEDNVTVILTGSGLKSDLATIKAMTCQTNPK